MCYDNIYSKVYARNLTKAEAKAIVDYELKKKEKKIKKSQTNSITRTIVTTMVIPLTFVCWPVGLVGFLLLGNLYWIANYKIGISISERMAKELEKCIPLYLFVLSQSFNEGIESLKTINEKYNNIYKNNAAPLHKNLIINFLLRITKLFAF